MTNAYNYNVVVRRIVSDNEAMFEARVKEFPDLTEYADSPEEAYALAIDAIETVAAVCAGKGTPMPEAMDLPVEYSGRVTLRLPKSLHRTLAETALEEEVSLNQHMVNVLCYFSGFAHAERSSVEHWISAKPQPKNPAHLRLVSTNLLQPACNESWPTRAVVGA